MSGKWYKTGEVPFSWREWAAIHKSSKSIHGQRDKRKDLSWQRGGSDFANKTIGTRMNFMIRGLSGDKNQIAQVKCYVKKKSVSHEGSRNLKNKRVTWMSASPKKAKFIEGKHVLPGDASD